MIFLLKEKAIAVRKGETTFLKEGQDYIVLSLIYDSSDSETNDSKTAEMVGSIDSAVLGRHFLGNRERAFQEGYYVVAAAVSDIGANAGEPTEAHVTLVNPIDDPIYTFFLRVGETMPDIVDVPPYDMVKYYVQFTNQEWIRISPVTRGDELDEDGNIVSKFFVLDKLNLGQISTDLKELPYNFPVFSFRIRIELDMNFIASSNFISPSIDFYECHVTDRNSFLRIE